jgi:FkbM family methyltransferase
VGDFIIDGGSCLGDTMLGFAAVAGEDGHVYGFDPCAGNLAVMRHNLAANPWARATIYPCGLSNRDQESESVPLPGISPGFSVDSVGSGTVPLRRIDTLVNTGLIQRVDFIKLDVEGSELATLLGAQDTLRRFTPKLAVSLYHRPNDLFTIPFYLRSLGLGYRFYLDHYTIHNEETVLYAMA